MGAGGRGEGRGDGWLGEGVRGEEQCVMRVHTLNITSVNTHVSISQRINNKTRAAE